MGDLRISVGGFFTLAGLIVTATGVATENRAPLDTANINLYSGIAMLVFGAAMLWLAWRRS
ncbi:MAG TPA: hypothetical protein VKX49_21975 [Bryobacteraceae bacterium]|nr:hypothetical protein [Bryobacteraceae bacterium]